MKNIIALLVLVVVLFAVCVDARKTLRGDSNDDDKEEKLVQAGKLYEARQKRGFVQAAQVKKLYQSVIWPASSLIGAAIIQKNYSAVSDFLVENVTGRVSPLGRFDSYLLTGEYFYALAGPLPGASTTGRTRVTNVTFTGPILCWNNTCKYRVLVEFRRFSDNQVSNIFLHVGHMNFDSTNRVCNYEANFVGMERQSNLPENNTVRQASISNLCNGVQFYCQGTNQQFNNTTECINFMNTKEYGGWGKADQDTWSCRLLHVLLARDDPVTHCPHTGPSGGGRCIVHAESTYLSDQPDACTDPSFP